jgi:hypothetical protein
MKIRPSLLSPSSSRLAFLGRRPPPSTCPPSARFQTTLYGPGGRLRLNEEDQRTFEDLVRHASQPPPPAKDATAAAPGSTSAGGGGGGSKAEPADAAQSSAQSAPAAEQQLHPDVRKGAPPEFEGVVNPKTGEVGGPKNEPLRWGANGDWSFNGRTTDF